MADTVAFNTTVVFQYQQAFHFQMPDRVEQRCRATAHAALRTGFHGGLEMFVERDTTGVECLAAADRAAERTDAARVDTDTGTLGHIFDNRTGGRVDGVKAVAALDQHTGAELAGRGADTGHNRCRQGNFEG